MQTSSNISFTESWNNCTDPQLLTGFIDELVDRNLATKAGSTEAVSSAVMNAISLTSPPLASVAVTQAIKAGVTTERIIDIIHQLVPSDEMEQLALAKVNLTS